MRVRGEKARGKRGGWIDGRRGEFLSASYFYLQKGEECRYKTLFKSFYSLLFLSFSSFLLFSFF